MPVELKPVITDHVFISVDVERERVSIDFRDEENMTTGTIYMDDDTARKLGAQLTGLFTQLDSFKKFVHAENITVTGLVITQR